MMKIGKQHHEKCEVFVSWLPDKPKPIRSQFGEDTLLIRTFGKIGTCNKWCFEVGCADGQYLSNTWIFRDMGWDAVLIDGDAEYIEKCRAVANDRERVELAHIQPGDLPEILDRYAVPLNMDLGVLDIDGQDYWIWKNLAPYQPRVMVVEHCQDDAPIPNLGDPGQAGFTAIRELAGQLGYRCVAATRVNGIYVREDLL